MYHDDCTAQVEILMYDDSTFFNVCLGRQHIMMKTMSLNEVVHSNVSTMSKN